MNRAEYLLAVLAEECAEVAQRCSKAQRFGLMQTQAGHELTNAQRIDHELQDLYAAVDMIQDELGVMSQFGTRDPKLIATKKEKVENYMAASPSEIMRLDREGDAK